MSLSTFQILIIITTNELSSQFENFRQHLQGRSGQGTLPNSYQIRLTTEIDSKGFSKSIDPNVCTVYFGNILVSLLNNIGYKYHIKGDLQGFIMLDHFISYLQNVGFASF